MKDDKRRPYRLIDQLLSMPAELPDETRREIAFYSGVSDPDDFTAVVRGISHLEAVLLELVTRNLEHPELIDLNGFSLRQRITWAQALGEIGPKTADALQKLAAIRNRLAHNHMRIFAPEDLIDGFLKAVAKLDAKGLDGPMPVDETFDPPLTETRWKMRMGITVLNQQLFNYTVVPPKRKRSRPGITITVPDDYEAKPPI